MFHFLLPCFQDCSFKNTIPSKLEMVDRQLKEFFFLFFIFLLGKTCFLNVFFLIWKTKNLFLLCFLQEKKRFKDFISKTLFWLTEGFSIDEKISRIIQLVNVRLYIEKINFLDLFLVFLKTVYFWNFSFLILIMIIVRNLIGNDKIINGKKIKLLMIKLRLLMKR